MTVNYTMVAQVCHVVCALWHVGITHTDLLAAFPYLKTRHSKSSRSTEAVWLCCKKVWVVIKKSFRIILHMT